jgi:hypothetical protein
MRCKGLLHDVGATGMVLLEQLLGRTICMPLADGERLHTVLPAGCGGGIATRNATCISATTGLATSRFR